jgi:hypothetical protein
MVGADGDALLAALDGPGVPAGLARLAEVSTVRAVWARHFERADRPPGERPPGRGGDPPATDAAADGGVRLRDSRALSRAAAGLESPYDADARFRTKRATAWTGYVVHVSEPCDQEDAPHLITHVDTTPATDHEATRTDAIHAALAAKGLPPGAHLVDAASVSAALPVRAGRSTAWTWSGHRGRCRVAARRRRLRPRGLPHRLGAAGGGVPRRQGEHGLGRVRDPAVHAGLAPRAVLRARFAETDCAPCALRARCITSGTRGRQLSFLPELPQRAPDAARARQDTDAGRALHDVRAGVEGPLSQAVRAVGLRRARYRGRVEDAGAARGHRGHRGRPRPRPGRRLVRRPPACRDPHVPLARLAA